MIRSMFRSLAFGIIPTALLFILGWIYINLSPEQQEIVLGIGLFILMSFVFGIVIRTLKGEVDEEEDYGEGYIKW